MTKRNHTGIRTAALWSLVLVLALSVMRCFEVPPYPYRPKEDVVTHAKQISDALEDYINRWFAGEVGSVVPDSLIPRGFVSPYGGGYRLIRFDDIVPREQQLVRKAHAIDRDSLYASFPDPNCTYMGDLKAIIPFGHKLVVEGEFPYCRFFSIQATPSFDPSVYHYGYGGEGEVPIVDVDIEPQPGHVNPFRVGADRMAPNRSYRVEFTAAIGNTWDLNEASRPPYRQASNHRYMSGIVYQGPWGDSAWTKHHASVGHGRDEYDCGQLWIRYYRPDSGRGWNAGVPLPKFWFETPDGRRYYMHKDLDSARAAINPTYAAPATLPSEPTVTQGSDQGWYKQFDIMLVGLEAIAWIYETWTPKQVRDLFLGITGKGEGLPKSRGTEAHKTAVPHINYLTRGMSLGSGKVAVLTGKLPTFPDTRDGAPVMNEAQMRYWSLTGYDNSKIMDGIAGMAVHSVCDDELVLDSTRHYILVLSRPQDRPDNCTAANGCTWEDWGPSASYSWTLRWMSVAPDWEFELSPDEHLLKWGEANWSGSRLNHDLISRNSHEGILGEYLPKVHYMSRAEFEALGDSFDYTSIPEWQNTAVIPASAVRARSSHSNAQGVTWHDLLGRRLPIHRTRWGSGPRVQTSSNAGHAAGIAVPNRP